MDNLHSGHRERLRQQFLASGNTSMLPHQLLELLLFYAIPRIDTNTLAHKLIHRFGGFRGVFDAEINELIDVDGVGSNAAVLIKLIPKIAELYYMSVYDGVRLADTETICAFLTALYNETYIEVLRLICFDDNMKVRENIILSEGDSSRVWINKRIIMQKVLNSGCHRCVLAHNHPNGPSKPSKEDILSTQDLISFLKNAGITLIDHIIIGDDGATAIINDGYCTL